jgi:hypothetical protein
MEVGTNLLTDSPMATGQLPGGDDAGVPRDLRRDIQLLPQWPGAGGAVPALHRSDGHVAARLQRGWRGCHG